MVNTLQNSREGLPARLAWIGAVLFSACIYSTILILFGVPGAGPTVSANWVMTTFGLGIVVFCVGLALGPVALAFLLYLLGEQLKAWAELSLRWVWCCPGGGSRGVGLLVLGSAFVGASFSTYVFIRYILKRQPLQIRHVIVGSVALAAFWLVVVFGADAACRRHFCPGT